MTYRNTGVVLLLILFFITPAAAEPVITLLGSNSIDVEVDSVYTDAGATAFDDIDGDLTSSIITVNPVNTAVKGTYTVTYNVYNSSNYPAIEVTRTVNVVDTTAPVIALLGSNPIDVEVDSVYTDAGATASDNYDGVITGSIVTVNLVNTAIKGTYTVTYNVEDSSGNPAVEVTRTVNVVDNTAPVITRLGTSPVTVEVDSVYTDAGATAFDDIDGDLTSSIITVNPVNTAVKGTYTVTYNVKDSSNNAATEVTRTVKVVDTTDPIITRLGTSPVTKNVGSVYTDAGATASDNYDGDITASIITVNPVNTAITGTYTVTYNVKDSYSNAATEVTRTVKVVDNTPPVITLKGNNPETVQSGTSYTEAGATVTDNYDTGITATITGSVNTAVVGSYTLTYNAVDSSSNTAIPVTRTVNVVDTSPPAWSLTPQNQIVQVGVSFSYDVSATDASTIAYSINDTANFAIGSGTGRITNKTGIVLTVGVYVLNITATDALDNSISQIITVTVQPEPTYSVSGYVFDNNNAGLINVNIQDGIYLDTSNATGYYLIRGLLNGSYNFSYLKSGFNTNYSLITISGSDFKNANMTIFDTTPPDKVTGLVYDTPSPTTVNMSWNSTANASHYQIFRNSSQIGTTQNSYWNDTGIEIGILYQYWVRANDSYNNWGENSSNLSVRTAFSTTPPPSSGGGSSSGGGGGGGGTSGENFTNIIVKEKYDLQIYKDIVTSYKFKTIENPILSINIMGNVNAGEIGTAVEVLRNTSSLVKTPAPDNVYKNVNIWVGTSGFGTSKNIKQAVITFRIENSWISSENLKSSGIKMVRWDGSKWNQLETSEKTKDSTYIYFEAKTDSFSSFAITGIEQKEYVTETTIMREPLEPANPAAAIQPEEKKSDFLTNWFLIIGVFFAIGLIIEMYLRLKKK